MANSFQDEQETPELVAIAELAENIVYRVPGCLDIMVRKTIRDIYREFCRETKCLTADRVLKVEDGRAEYPVSAFYGGVVGEIREVLLEKVRLMRGRDYKVIDGTCPMVVLDRRYLSFPDHEIPEGEHPARRRIYAAEERIVHRHPRMLRIKATEIPKIGSELAPQWFIDKHGDSVVSGVLARLCAMTGRAWSDAQVAGDERIRYENAKSEARMFNEVLPGPICVDASVEL